MIFILLEVVSHWFASPPVAMGDELDALFELSDDEEFRADDGHVDKLVRTSALKDAAHAMPEADQAEDMLLFLADECALDTPQLVMAPAPAGKASGSSTPRGSAFVNDTASAHSQRIKPTNKIGSSAPAATVRTSQSKAFTVINASAQAADGLRSRSSASRSGLLRLGGTSGAHNSSSTSSKAGKQQSSHECQHFVEKLTNLKVVTPAAYS